MKYLKRFNEAIIRPYDFDQVLDEVKTRTDFTIESLNELFSELDVKLVDVDYFKSKLQTKKEIELVPVDMEMMGGIRFSPIRLSARNIHTNMMYVCVNEKRFLDGINENGVNKENVIHFLREILRY